MTRGAREAGNAQASWVHGAVLVPSCCGPDRVGRAEPRVVSRDRRFARFKRLSRTGNGGHGSHRSGDEMRRKAQLSSAAAGPARRSPPSTKAGESMRRAEPQVPSHEAHSPNSSDRRRRHLSGRKFQRASNLRSGSRGRGAAAQVHPSVRSINAGLQPTRELSTRAASAADHSGGS